MDAAYFDHNATTPLDPEVRTAMLPWMGEIYGNPSAVHSFGRNAREAVERARDQVASLLDAAPPEIVFTASGTEANNAVLATLTTGEPGHLVLSAFEHPSIDAAVSRAQVRGWTATRVRPNREGRVEVGDLESALREDTRLVALMLVNNELGTVQPVAEAAEVARSRGVPVLCDAVQAVGKIPVSVQELGVDYLTVGAHKFYGPLGAAALWVRSGAPFEPYLLGGSQERHRRAGTLNVAALVGFGQAAEQAAAHLDAWRAHTQELRDRFEAGLASVGDHVVHGAETERSCNTSNVAFPGLHAQALMIRLDLAGFAVSTGSACGSGAAKPSRTLDAMGLPDGEASASLRVSFGKTNTLEQVDGLLATLAREVAELRRSEPTPVSTGP